MKKLLIAILALSFSSVVMAEDHPIATITGTGIDLKTYDHAIAGSIRDFLVWGFVDEATFSSELIMRRDGQIVRANFKKDGDKIGGVIQQQIDGKSRETAIYLKGINKEQKALLLEIAGEPVTVTIQFDKIENDHFINPVYTATIRGETVSFRLEGDACYGFSFHLAALILGAYAH
ncbi:MAG: hypothetical protein A2X94_04075 [Bdellovibrionales bacterium GWB1_55_8]|nr:MAG: hypothetical protein A2X94_04075 [Bdellovibrionales bacterium GWB1_55_8]